MKDYAHPEVLVDTQWLAEHLDDPKVRIVDIHLDPTLYESGHIPGAVFWPAIGTLLKPDWQINFDTQSVEDLCARSGIANDTTVVAYSEQNALAPWVFWFLRSVGHADVRVLNGGRQKWVADGHALTTEPPAVSAATYTAHDPKPELRALQDRVRAAVGKDDTVLLDVRTPEEYRGRTVSAGSPRRGRSGAGISPGLPTSTMKTPSTRTRPSSRPTTLAALYESQGVTADKETITYCAVGIRSAHTWFVLTQLLGYSQVRSFDASWNLWGRLPDTPVEAGDGSA